MNYGKPRRMSIALGQFIQWPWNARQYFSGIRAYWDIRIKGFLKTKLLVLRYFISCFWHNVEWVSKGGIDSRPAA